MWPCVTNIKFKKRKLSISIYVKIIKQLKIDKINIYLKIIKQLKINEIITFPRLIW